MVQALPDSIADPAFAPLRPLATLSMTCNAVWLVLFAHQLLWVALVVIVIYMLTLYAFVASTRTNTVAALATITRPGVWRRLIGQHAFSAHAAWVTIATFLQFEINLLEVRAKAFGHPPPESGSRRCSRPDRPARALPLRRAGSRASTSPSRG